MTASIEPRPIHPLLMLGLITLPIVFYWFLLLPGYAGSTRIAAAWYMLMVPALTLIAGVFGETQW